MLPATISAVLTASLALGAGSEKVQFNRDVRPILSDACYACHGPDKNKRKKDLRLDTRAGLLGDGSAGGAVVPGSLEKSKLYQRLIARDAADRMPPEGSGKSITPKQIETLRRWIEEGAPWQGHWSYLPLARPAPPETGDDPFVRGDIDRFILKDLRAHGLKPAPEADRITLLRRLSFDLTGLPPGPEDVRRFAGDASPGAYEALVDRLLASPHFGERLAVWWLDLARYADSVGYHGDQNQTVWPYRDYVIGAFNDDVGFDRFTREQLAGDLLPGATRSQKIAAAYNRLSMKSAEGGVQDREYLAKYAAERVRAVGGAWLGSTFGCCECHDHKFDPFTAKDFYSFESFFSDIAEVGIFAGSHETGSWGEMMAVPTAAQEAELKRLDGEVAAAKKALETPAPEVTAAQAAWEASVAAWVDLEPVSASSQGGAKLEVRGDRSIAASGTSPDTDVYTVEVKAPAGGITAIKLEVLPDDSLPKKGPGRATNGNFVLTELSIKRRLAGGAVEEALRLRSASADFEQKAAAGDNPYGKWSAEGAIDGDAKGPRPGWAILEEVARPHEAVFETGKDSFPGDDGRLVLVLAQRHGGNHTIGRFRLSATTAPRPVRAGRPLPQDVRDALAASASARTDAQRAAIAAHFRSITPLLEPQRRKLDELTKARADLDKSIVRMVATVSVAPRTLRVLKRGNWMDDTGEVVSPAVPAFLPRAGMPADRRLTRLDLADWLVSAENPLVARVVANRLWKLLLGAGLSRRVDDLGSQGDWPSHPELLDWLACELQGGGWSLKRWIRTVVLSGTYRQSSVPSQESRELDPENRWLSRQGRFRLDAEFVRDAALAASGLLVRDIGGPSVRPYQPPGYWAYLNFPPREWQDSSGEGLYRRGLYTHWQRQYLHPSMLAFDAPCREECTADRSRSNTPLQALALLNDPEFVEAARVFAERIVREGGSAPANRIDWAFRTALSRSPRQEEAAVLEALYRRRSEDFARDEAAARDVLKTGARPATADMAPADLAAWTSVARALLNLHETYTRN